VKHNIKTRIPHHGAATNNLRALGTARPIRAIYYPRHHTAKRTRNLHQRCCLERASNTSKVSHTIKCTRGIGNWFPIEFNEEHVCWVEVHLQEPAGSEAYWQAFQIAGEDLGVDITQADVELHIQNNNLQRYRESIASSHSSRASTPSVTLR
jgi:hypothetical protein